MATPQDLTTTVNGRRCTRSRARTAATSTLTSSEPPAVSSTSQLTTSTTSQAAKQVGTSATDPPPAPAPPPSSTSSLPSTSTSPTIGTSSAVSSSQVESVFANAVSSVPVVAEASSVAASSASELQTASAAAVVITTSSTAITSVPTSSDSITAAALSSTSTSSLSTSALSSPSSPSTSTPSSAFSSLNPALSSTVAAVPDTAISSALPSNVLSKSQPGQPQPTTIPPGGIISPDASAGGNGLTISTAGRVNVAGIAGGVVGGVVFLALISALVFFCLRRRKRETSENRQNHISEKRLGGDGQFTKTKEKLKAFPAGVGLFFEKMKGKKAGPSSNPYRRHIVRSSVSSVYSVQPSRRSQSISEPPSNFRQQFLGFGDRMPSLKRAKTLLQKKQDGSLVGSQSPFPGIVEDPVLRNSRNAEDPFKDPTEPPRNLVLMNPGLQSRRGSADGLQGQQRGPVSPPPAARSGNASKDPLVSVLDKLDSLNGSGTPEWLRENAQRHKRTTSAQTALRSHPPSNYTASVYTNAENPFFDPSDAPPVPTQLSTQNPPVRPANAYAPRPALNQTPSTLSLRSDVSYGYSEAGPTRPGTNTFGSKLRQSDPFDLDRPEVLNFGDVGGRTIQGSIVTRQNSRKRGSSIPNWINFNDSPYESARERR